MNITIIKNAHGEEKNTNEILITRRSKMKKKNNESYICFGNNGDHNNDK